MLASARLLTLGRLALLDGEERDLLPTESMKLLGLLAFLVAAPGRRATREQLIDLLWDDRSIELGRGSLRQAIHRLRDILGDGHLSPGNGDVVLSAALACDRDEFLAAVAAGTLDEVLARYGGSFVPGYMSRGGAAFERWRDQERERLHLLFAAAAESVAQRALQAGEPKRASAIATRLLADHPFNERAWRLRLQAEQAAGSHIHLVASIAELRRLLASEGWQPEARTLQLLQSLERPLEVTASDRDVPQLMTDLIGRGPVLAMLYTAWREATHHQGVHLHLTGYAGLGKTRVMDDFAIRLQAERVRVARARALPRQRFVPGAMLASLIGALVELPGAKGISEHSARILLGLQPAISTHFPGAAPLEFAQSDTRFLAQLEALDDLIGAVSHDSPVCLLLDDVHWWDDLSRRTIEHVIERLDGRPVLVVTASRPGTGELTTACTRENYQLSPLTAVEVVELLQSLGEHPDAAAVDRLAAGLQRDTDGVPLLLIEAIRLGLDRGLLGLADQRWNLDRLDEFLAILRPGRLLSERLAILTAPQRALLLVAWLAEFPLVATDATAVDGGADAGTLMELERLGFLASTHAGWVVSHDSIGEAAEVAASAEALRRAHHAAGVLTRRRGDQAALLAQAAKLFLEAGAEAELLETASLWLRQQRAEHDISPVAELVGELLGPGVSPAVVRTLVTQLPRNLRRSAPTPWRQAPFWVTVGAVMVASGWWATSRQPPPDAILGVLERGATGQVNESQIALRQGAWAASDFKMEATRLVRVSEWGASVDSLDAEPIKDPTRNRWVSARLLKSEADPNGPTDLVLRENGVTRPLAPAPGDDASPSWSPDGRFVAISTTRWSPRSDANFDIGVVDVATGVSRQLTSSPDADLAPYWSPDGTRIAFIRRSERLAPDSLCWVAVDGLARSCRGVTGGQLSGISGWIDNHSVVVIALHDNSNRVEFDDVDGGPDRVTELSPNATIKISADGAWLVQMERQFTGSETGLRLTVNQVATPGLQRSVLLHANGPPLVYWDQAPVNRALAALALLSVRDTIFANTPFRLKVEGTAATGKVMPVPKNVIVWTSSDERIATVDADGDVRGRATGAVTITASAGGWRKARIRLVVRQEQTRVLFEERWQQDWSGSWLSWGTPLPRLTHRADGSNAMLSNGDGVYSSGLVTRQRFDARNGLALDVEVSTPITRSKWQMVKLWIDTPAAPSFSGPGGLGGCGLAYPAGEGWLAHTMIMGTPADSSLATGKWYRLRVQLFPDGSCGYALNGRALVHSPDIAAVADSMVIALGGQTVGSELLFGRVQVLSGVPGNVDWGAIGKKGKREHR